MAEERICFYHTDGDGYASGALIARMFDWDIRLYPINYHHDFPNELVGPETEVYMVDFALQPFERMLELRQKCGKLVWIDHHETEVKAYWEWAGRSGEQIEGPKQIGEAGCELTWQYVMNRTKPAAELEEPAHPCTARRPLQRRARMPWTLKMMPRAVHLLGRYDVWDWENVLDALEFQMGFRAIPNTSPVQDGAREFWDALLGDNLLVRQTLEDRIIREGRTIVEYRRKDELGRAKASAFMADLKGVPVLWANQGMVNSQFFDGILEDWPDARAVGTFQYRKGAWTFSIYQIKGRGTPNLGEIAKSLGGGGHAGAAGFQVYAGEEWPFELPLKAREV